MSDKTSIQRDHKDTIFHDLFSDKENALSLYNALNNTAYPDTEDMEVVTLSDAIHIHRKNDVSILFQDRLELWEHQSTKNGNMPLRGLLYYAREMDGILAARGEDLYGKRILKISAPDHDVFYNGLAAVSERQDLHLSDAFAIPIS